MGSLSPFIPVMQPDFPVLEREVTLSLHSRKQHDHTGVIYQNHELFDPINEPGHSGYLPTVHTMTSRYESKHKIEVLTANYPLSGICYRLSRQNPKRTRNPKKQEMW
jgi:hypothetical protein